MTSFVLIPESEKIVPAGKYQFFYVESEVTMEVFRADDPAVKITPRVVLHSWDGVATVTLPITRGALYEDVVRSSRRHLFNTDTPPTSSWKVHIIF